MGQLMRQYRIFEILKVFRGYACMYSSPFLVNTVATCWLTFIPSCDAKISRKVIHCFLVTWNRAQLILISWRDRSGCQLVPTQLHALDHPNTPPSYPSVLFIACQLKERVSLRKHQDERLALRSQMSVEEDERRRIEDIKAEEKEKAEVRSYRSS